MTTRTSPPISSAPAALAVDPDALMDVAASLRRYGDTVLGCAELTAPDTGATSMLTREALGEVTAANRKTGGDLVMLGSRLVAFVGLVADADDRARARIDRVRGGALW